MCVYVCMCVLTFKGGSGCFRCSVMQVFATVTQYFDTKKTLYLKEHPAKLLKTYLKDNGNIYFVVI